MTDQEITRVDTTVVTEATPSETTESSATTTTTTTKTVQPSAPSTANVNVNVSEDNGETLSVDIPAGTTVDTSVDDTNVNISRG
jgi:hypothetical protein